MSERASIADQRETMRILRYLESTEDEAVLEAELIRKSFCTTIRDPIECINSLIKAEYIRRINAPSRSMIRRTEHE